MPDASDETARLQAALDALQAASPELDPTAALVLLAVREHQAGMADRGINTVRLARMLDIEHALIRRAATELEAGGHITSTSVGGASPALRLLLT